MLLSEKERYLIYYLVTSKFVKLVVTLLVI